MLRRICNLCQVADTTSIRNLRKYTVTPTLKTYVNMFPNGKEEEDEKEDELKSSPTHKLAPIIACRRKAFNFYPGTVYKKFDSIPIASHGWHHNKAKGDYFTINPIIENDYDDDEEHEKCEFEDFGLDPHLIENVKKNGIHKPTTIQERGIPEILDGRNVVITAETGCGKTLTYLLPIVNQTLKWKSAIGERPANSPFIVIVTPSRELTLQIGIEVKQLTNGLDIDVKTLTGGRTKKLMRSPSLKNVDILIGTLGVTSKLTAVQMYKLNYVRYTVIDEAHALFDETFDEKMTVFLRRINFGFKQPTDAVPHSSQLILVSATMPEQLPEYINQNVNLESMINVATRHCHRVLVPQKFLRLGEVQKPLTLLKLIKSKGMKKIPTIVFSNSGSTSDWVSIFLNQMNIKAISLNSQMRMEIRKDKFRIFHTGEVNVLSTTNAGARGLDTVMVERVINYDFPMSTADYIHRCGRTGRIGGASNGRVINFITKPLEIDLVQKIERATRRNRALPIFNIRQQQYEKAMNDEFKFLLNSSKTM